MDELEEERLLSIANGEPSAPPQEIDEERLLAIANGNEQPPASTAAEQNEDNLAAYYNKSIDVNNAASKLSGVKEGDLVAVEGRDGKLSLKKMNAPVEGASVLEDVDDVPDMNKTYPTLTADEWDAGRESGKLKMNVSPARYRALQTMAETGADEKEAGELSVVSDVLPFGGRRIADKERGKIARMEKFIKGEPELSAYSKEAQTHAFPHQVLLGALGGSRQIRLMSPDEQWAEEARMLGVKGDLKRGKDEDEDAYHKRLQGLVEEKMKETVSRQDWAKKELSYIDKDWKDIVFGEGRQSIAYGLEFAATPVPLGGFLKAGKAANILVKAGSKIARAAIQTAPVAIDHAASDYEKFRENGYTLRNGDLVIESKGDDPGTALWKAIKNNETEAILEVVGGDLAAPVWHAVGKTIGKHAVGKVLVGIGKKFGKIRDATHFGDPFFEENLFEEVPQYFFSDVLGWGKKDSEYKGFYEELANAFGYEKKVDPETGVERYEGSWLKGDGMYTPRGFWNTSLAMLLQMGGQAAIAAPSAGLEHIKNNRELANILEGTGMTKEQVANLSYAQREAFRRFHKHFADNPEELKWALTLFDKQLGSMADELVKQTTFKTMQTIMDYRDENGQPVKPHLFEVQTETGPDGKPRPKFNSEFIVRADGKSSETRRQMFDPKAQVTIVDNGDGTYDVHDEAHPDQSAHCETFAEAQQQANFYSCTNQKMRLDNKAKEQYARTLTEGPNAKYKNPVVFAGSVKDVYSALSNAIRNKGGMLGINADNIRQVFKTAENGEVLYPPRFVVGNTSKGLTTPDGTKIIILDNISSPGDMNTVLSHEAGHAAGRANQQERLEMLRRASPDSEVGRLITQLKALNEELGNKYSEDKVLDEAFSSWLSKRGHNPSLVQRISHKMLGKVGQLGDADFEVIASQIEKGEESGSGENVHFFEDDQFDSTAESAAEPGTPTVAPEAMQTAADERISEEHEQGEANETAHGADEAPAQPEQGADGVPQAGEAARPVEGEPPRAEAPREGVVEPSAEETAEEKPAAKPVAERNIVEKLTDQAPVHELPIEEVVNDDTRIPNFKEGADPETGEVEPLTGEPYDLVSNPIVVMEFKDGKKVVVTGRHRLALYKRSGRKTIAARVIREADGWTVDDAKAIDAIGNIIDEKGTVKDYVNYFNNAKPTREEAKAGGFLDRPKGQRAFSIFEGATEATKAVIDWNGTGGDGLISADQAGIIAEAAPRDENKRFGAVQRILVQKALAGLRGKKLGILARSLAEESKTRKDTPNVGGEMQLDLFTSEDDQKLLAMEEKRSDYRVKKAEEYGRIAEVLRTALAKGGKLDLNADYAKELGITDPNDRKQLAAARDKAVERANYWENAVTLDEADKAAMDAEISAKADAKAKKLAELKAKREAAKSGASRSGAAPSASKAEPSAPETRENTPLSAPAKTEATTPPKTEKPAEAKKSLSAAKPAPMTRAPSIKMKDEAAEKLARQQEDDLAALFDTPEFGIMRGDDEKKHRLVIDTDRLGGGLGIPDNAVPNRQLIEKVCDILGVQGETAARSMWAGRISQSTAKALFDALNSDPESKRIFDRVFPVAQALGIEFSLVQYNGNDGAGADGMPLAEHDRGAVRLFANTLQYTDPQTVASTILHETIHGVTVYVMEVADGTIKTPKTRLTPELEAAAREVFAIYDENRKWMGKEYGATNAYEMIAELANPKFRAQLKRKSLWHRLWDAVKRMFGFNVNDAHDAALNALDKFVENYSREVFDSYVKDANRNNLDVDLLGIGSRLAAGRPEASDANQRFLKWAKKWKLDPAKEKNQREWARKNSVDFQDPEFDPDMFQKRVGAVAKLVKTYKDSGVADFRTLATRMAERFPEKFGAMRPYLRGVWNAVAEQMGLDEVSRGQADEIYGIIDNQQTKEVEDDRRGIRREVSEGEPAPGGSGGVGLAEGQPASEGGERGSGVLLAGGRGREQGSDEQVDSQRSGVFPGQSSGLVDKGAREEGAESGGGASEATVPGDDRVGHERGERAAGEHSSGSGSVEEGQRGADNDSSPRARVKKAAKKAADSTKPNPFRRDFVMTKAVEEAILEKSPINRIRQNIAAIKLIRELAQKDFVATPDEQTTLAKYVGWGGLSEMFSWEYDRAWSMGRDGALKSEVERMARRGKYGVAGYEAYKELRQTLNDEEYGSARASTTTAFYTPIHFVRALHDALRNLGVKGGRFLGPSAGTGNFASAEGEYEKPVNWQFVEKDQVTGMILKALFPNQRVNISGFEETKFPDGFFDFAIDNVPYADVPITDRSLSPHSFKIHDYFFAKTLAKLRPGGVMAFLTSTGTLDKTSPILRHFLTEHGGKIVGAVRLPNGFFSENAGTDVASDLVIVQKVEGRPDNSAFEKQEVYTHESGPFNRKTRQYDQKPVGYNGYFKDHPEQVVGKMAVANGQFGPTLKYTMPDVLPGDLSFEISKAIGRALGGIDKDALLKSVTVAAPEERAPVYDDEGLRQGNVTMKDGKPFIKSGEMLEPISMPSNRTLTKELGKRLKSPVKIMEGLIGLRKAMRGVIDAQMRGVDDEGLKPLLATLNEVYDKFVKQNGTLHDKWVTPFVMLDKADGNRMLALERTVKDESGKSKVVKSDIFTKRVISRGQRATKADTPKDALVISYSETGGINVPRIAELLGVDADEAVAKLKESGDAFENPQTGRLEPSWEYLSGRVRAKLAAARAAVEAGEESYRANVEALEKVQPPMVKLEDTEIKFGATWVDPECMKDFLRDAFGSEHMRISLNKNELTGQWNVEFDRVMNEDPWGETSWAAQEFVSRVLNHGSMEHIVTDPVDKKKYRDERRTEANKLAADKLHSAFSQFIQSSDKWAEPMYERYNAVMTDNVGIKLPNNILPFRAAGMSEETLRMLFEDGDTSRPKKGREYQSDVIARGVLGGSSLCLAHCVGAGKTLEMQAIGMIGRRLGMFKKSMYVVPNHMLDQFVNEFTRAFPDANLLKMTAEDVKPANRRAFFAQVSNGDWDAIVVKHSTFSQKLGMSKQYQEDFMIQQKKDLIAAIGAMKEAGERISVKQGEKMLARLEDKLKKLGNAEGKDKELVPFEELGVDQLFVDEAHNFKGMPITTRQGRTGGLQTGDSQRAEDMHMKTQYVQSLHGGDRGVVFATGTPLSNAPVVEAYVMLKYLAPQKLAEQGLSHFDDFVDAFGRITTETEFNEDGKTTKEKDKISAFVNIPDFMKLFKSVVDIVNSDQLDIPRPKPKYRMIDVDMSDAQRIVMEAVARESGEPAGKEWPSKYMDLTWVAKLACISPRLLGFEDGGNKIIRAVSEVKKVYDETASEKGTQLIFTDRFQVGYQKAAHRVLGDQVGGMAAGSADFNLNEEIRDLLVAAGIPKDEIAIIQDIDKSKGDKDANKEALFAKVRAGEVRVLIGSRPKMGEGTNVQERLAAIHLLHPGWKPSEDEQAIGRIIRNGNMFKEGQIFYYLTKGNENIGSYETKNHQLIGVKSRLIDQVMHSDDSVRSVEMDESAMDRDMLMGLASGNKALMELIDVKKRVHKLELNTESTLTSARRNKDKAEANSRILERRREEFAKEQEGVREWREKNEGKPFTLSTPDGRSIEKVKDMAEYVSGEMTKLLTQDRYDREESTVIGDFNGVELVLAFDKWGDEKFKLAVPLLGVEREINYSGFLPDFSQGAMTAFKGRIFETVSPDFAKAYENQLADMDRQAKKMSADADKLQKDYEGMRVELAKLRRRQTELERAVTPLVVQTVEDRSVAAYGNWAITKDKIDLGMGLGYTAERESDGKNLHAPTVKELIPLMDAEDFASPKNAATKTPELRNRLKPNSKGETPSVDTLSVGQVDFDTPELNDADFARLRNYRDAGSVEEAGEILKQALPADHRITNDRLGITVEISYNDISKMTSEKATKKSVSPRLHALAVANADTVFKSAFIDGTHPDTHGRKEVLQAHRLGSAVFDPDSGTFAPVMVTVLEYVRDGVRMYSIEAIDLAKYENPAGQLVAVTVGERQTPITEFVNIIANSVSSRQGGAANFDTPELTPAEAEYAEAEDKTPTEKVMREVYGMTNDEIATAVKAAGMEPVKGVRKSDEQLWQQAETLLSNPSYMAKLSRAAFRFARPLRDYENVALSVLLRERQAKVNKLQQLHDELVAIPKEDIKETPELADELKGVSADLAKAKSEMYETATAMTQGASEQGRSLRSNRVLLDKYDLSFAGISQMIAEDVGSADKISPEMTKDIKELADKFSELDEQGRELYRAKLKAFSDKTVAQIKNGAKIRRATERKAGDEAKRVTKNYMEALAQIEVGAAEVGGTLIGIPDQQYPGWGKWLKWIGEFHCYENPEITEEEVIKAIVDDISPFVTADEDAVRDALTGYGHNYKMSRYDSQRLMNDLRAQALEKVKQREMAEKGTLPLATGPQRDEPSDTLRAERKTTYEMKKEIPDEARDARHLKGLLDSAKTRIKNRIADMERAIETGEKIPARERKVVEDIELRNLKKRKAELQALYDEMFKTERGMTEEQRIAATEKALARELEMAMEDYARAQSGDFSKRPKRPGVTSPTIDALRDRISEVRDSIMELKKAKYEYGKTPEEVAALHARKMANREKAIMRLAERIVRGDLRPQKKPQPPMPTEMQKQYDELGAQMKNAHRTLNQMREAAKRAAFPPLRRFAGEYIGYFSRMLAAHMASFDRSAVGRQAWALTTSKPIDAAKAYGTAEKAAWSEKRFQQINEDLLADPVVREGVEKYGLRLRSSDIKSVHDVEMFSGVDAPPPKIIKRLNEILDKIPLFGSLYKGARKLDRAVLENSERHYVTYLNLMAAQTYRLMVEAMPGATDFQKREVAGNINMLCGAGKMSEKLRNAINAGNEAAGHLIWSPGLAASQIQRSIFYDVYGTLLFASRDGGRDGKNASSSEAWEVQKGFVKLRARSLLASLALGALLMWFWSDDDEWDEYKEMWKRASKNPLTWFKPIYKTLHPVLGKTHIDLEMGQKSFENLLGLAVMGEYDTSTGRTVKIGDFGAKDLFWAGGRYVGGKLSPHYSNLIQILNRRSYTGEPIEFTDLLISMLPLTPVDAVKSAVEDRWDNGQAPVAMALTFAGLGGNVYDERYYDRAVNQFKSDLAFYRSVEDDETASTEDRRLMLDDIKARNPLMSDDVRNAIEGWLRQIDRDKRKMADQRKKGATDEDLQDYVSDIESAKEEVMKLVRESRRKK